MRLLIAHRSSEAQAALADAVRRGAEEPVEVTASGDGADVLELLLQDEPPEVAFIDWDLPGIDGPEMCRLVRDFHHGHDTWLVVLAGSAHRDTGDAWRAGADDCVATPAPAADLYACVDKGLRAMRAQRVLGSAERARGGRDAAVRRAAVATRPSSARRLTPCAGPTAAATTSSTSAAPPCGRRRTPRADDGSVRSGRVSRRPAADEPTGAALLEAVLQQP